MISDESPGHRGFFILNHLYNQTTRILADALPKKDSALLNANVKGPEIRE